MMRFWNKRCDDDEVFVRVNAREENEHHLIVLCCRDGIAYPAGYVMRQDGHRYGFVSPDVAARAGLELDGSGAITDESLAKIIRGLACA